MADPHLPTDYQTLIHRSRYSRYQPEWGYRETWADTVGRLMTFWREQFDEKALPQKDLEELRQAILNLEVMPSMRSLMTAGPALERDHVAGYNCAFTTIDSPRSFDEICFILLCGTGVGFSVQHKYVNKLPEVAEDFHETDTEIVVADSKIGWASAFRELVSLLYAGKIPKYDMSRIRPAGAPLHTFGGRASGPEPLRDLFEFSKELFQKAAGRQLTSIECHDLVCKVAEIVVVGGVRRSALISLSDLSDDRMRNAKSGQWWLEHPYRALANNSYVAEDKPDFQVFLHEWYSLYKAKSGERGIFSLPAAQNTAARNGRRDETKIVGTNPCVTGDTNLLTRYGYYPIEKLVDKEIDIWNGLQWSPVKPFSTGINEIVKLEFTDGTVLECTPYHKFPIIEGFNNNSAERVEAQDLEPGMKLQKWDMPVVTDGKEYDVHAYSQGFYSGDGTKNQKISWVYGEKDRCFDRLSGRKGTYHKPLDRWAWHHGEMRPKDFVPIDGSLEYCLNWLAGLLDADGTVTRDANGNGLQIVSIDPDFLLDVKLMLSRLGVRAKVVSGNEARRTQITNQLGTTGWYDCKASKRLLIGNSDTLRLIDLGIKFERLKVHSNPPQRDARQYIRVKSIEWTGREEETFCVNEPALNQMTVNGIVTSNCSEILLRDKQFCNLSECVVRETDTLDDIKNKARIAAILGTLQSTLTDFRYLRKKWRDNCEEERLLGVSLTGICDHPSMTDVDRFGTKHITTALEELKDIVVTTNKEWSDRLGVSQSTATTCIKPSGTVSQLVDSASGIHPRFAPYYIRRIRQDKKDPVSQFLIDQGFPYENDQMNNQAYVFAFPMKAPEGAVCAKDMGAMRQLGLWKVYAQEWAEHKPSQTVYYNDDEFLEVGNWIWNNFDEVSGISFLPLSDHTYAQAPYEEISESEYKEMLNEMPKDVDWDLLGEYDAGEDKTNGTHELACSGGQCDL